MGKLSIIIPVYNGIHTIGQLLDDVSRLEIPNYEVIVVNDGSIDDTSSIIQHYSSNHKFIKLVNQKNQGVSSARNHGLKVSEGKYIVFLDADDRIEPLKFKEFFCEIVQAGAEYSFTGYTENNFRTKSNKTVDTTGKGIYDLESFMSVFFDNLKLNLISYPINKVFLKSIIDKYDIRFNENTNFAEDLLFNLDYIKYANSFYISNCNYYIYQKYINENSLSSKFHMGFWEARKIVYTKLNLIRERLSEKKVFKSNQDKYAANVIIYTSRQIISQEKSFRLIIQDLRRFVEDEYLKEIINREVYITKHQKLLFEFFKTKKLYLIYIFWKLFEIKDVWVKLKISI